MPACRGSISAMLLYDVAEEIDLKALYALLGAEAPLRSPGFRQPAPQYVRFEQAPAVEPTGSFHLATGESVDARLRYFDYGVVSLEIELHFHCDWHELIALSHRWIEAGEVEQRGLDIVRRHVQRVRSSLTKPYAEWLDEAYYVVHLHEVRNASGHLLNGHELLTLHGSELSQILRGETQPLSEAERKDILSSGLSYFPSDLLLVGWLAAIVYDSPHAAAPVLEILEYANTQLLEYRRYDEILSVVLKHAYSELDRRGGPLASWRLAREARRMNRLRLEVTELTERTDTAIKFLSDMFYARAYKLAAAKVGATDYRNLVDQKLRTAGELYHFMVNEFRETRAFLMELTIILILVIELLPILKVK
ncbi:MAG: hypothetical protein ACK5TN_11525 [Acidobacteriota bacterium]